MNNQPLPKPTQVNKNNDPKSGGDSAAPPPSALNKKGVVFDGNKAKSRIPLAQKSVGGKNPVGDKTPVQNKSPNPGGGVKLPPTSLSALSSMSSNTIPKDQRGQDKQGDKGVIQDLGQKPLQKPTQPKKFVPKSAPGSVQQITPKQDLAQGNKNIQQPVTPPNLTAKKTAAKPIVVQKTVLGAPIPQAIRGEELPKGLATNSPNLASQAPSSVPPATTPLNPATLTPTPLSPAPGVDQEKTSPVPVAPNKDISKGSASGNSKNENKPKFASEKKSVLKFLPFIVGGIAILAIAGFVISKLFGGGGATPLPSENNNTVVDSANKVGETEKRTEVPAEQKELVYWGLWEPNEVVQEIIDDFESENPGVRVTYVKQSHKDYRERLQTALESGDGPDIFRFHASWTPMLKSDLYPIPSSVVSSKEFKDDYYPIVTDQLVVGGQYVGVPLMYDGLALYYNEDILESASETPPSTWAELRLLAAKLTVKSANGIERAGLAIGNTENIDHFADVLAILMLQNGADFSKPNSQETRDAFLFYTNFVSKDGVWDEKFPSSTVAFARGDVAMMFAPSWRAHEIFAQNPNLRFKTMPLPQLSDERITWGSYWAEGINSGSENKEIASEFLGYLSSDENLMKLFSKASEVRAFGEIYPKASMAEKLVNDGIVASYLDDAVYAQGWYLNSFTHDNGINDQMIEYYKDGINAVLEGEDVEDVLITIEEGTKQLLKQYGISSR